MSLPDKTLNTYHVTLRKEYCFKSWVEVRATSEQEALEQVYEQGLFDTIDWLKDGKIYHSENYDIESDEIELQIE
jgi:hypothetical protein